MAASNPNPPHQEEVDLDFHDDDNTLDAEEADEVIEDDGDVPMDSDEEGG
jgi:hypothetical protein